ncbi:MAG: hypothetical protein V5A39_02220 [Haloarculaceae archaeon]
MTDETDLEDEFDAEVTVEQTPPGARGREGVATVTVYCEAGSEEEVRERIEDLEAELAFETRRRDVQ